VSKLTVKTEDILKGGGGRKYFGYKCKIKIGKLPKKIQKEIHCTGFEEKTIIFGGGGRGMCKQNHDDDNVLCK
jgi:hypothetical protein